MSLLVRYSSAAWAAALALIASCVAPLIDGSERGVLLWVLVIGVVVLGLPHGAADPWVASATRRRSGSVTGRLAFFGAYTGLALLVVAAWSLWPLAILIAFLLISIVHFGLADTRGRSEFDEDRVVATLQRGLLPIVLPIALYPVEVAAVFGELVGADPVSLESGVVALGKMGLAVLALLSAWLLWRCGRRRGARASFAELVESGGLATLFLVLPLLPAFALYFGAWHSLRHLFLLRETLLSRMVSARSMAFGVLAIWAASVGFLAAAPELLGTLTPSGSELARTTVVGVDLLPAIFVGLAGLTVPHVILTDFVAGRRGTWKAASGG